MPADTQVEIAKSEDFEGQHTEAEVRHTKHLINQKFLHCHLFSLPQTPILSVLFIIQEDTVPAQYHIDFSQLKHRC